MDPKEPLPTDSLERRRQQNRSAQRKYRQKRSFNRAAQVAQLSSTSSIASTPSTTSQPSLLWSGQQENNLSLNSFASDENQLQPHTFDSIDFGGIFPASSATIDDINYSTPDAEVGVFSSLNTLTSFTVPPVLRTGGYEFSYEAWSPGNITPPNGTTSTDLPNPFTLSYNPPYKPDSRLPPTPLSFQGSLGLKPSSQQSHLASGSSSEIDTYARHHYSSDSGRSDFASTSKDWLPALHIAAQKGHERIVRILLEQGVNINEKDSEGKTALHFATIKGNDSVVRVLLAHGANIEEPDCEGRTSIHWAILERHENVIRLLLETPTAGSDRDIDALDKNGWTALHIAVERGFEAGLQLLLRHGANLSIKARRCPYTGNIIPPGQEIGQNIVGTCLHRS